MAKKLMSVFGGGNPEQQAQQPAAAVEAEGGESSSGAQNTANRLPVMVLGKTLTFKGELSAEEDMMLLGRVEGSIRHTSSLTVGIGGVVVGNIHARVLVIKGNVEGDVEATESVTIAPTAEVTGDIVAPSVCIVEGAQFNGAVEMPEAPVRAASAGAPQATTEPLADKDVEKLISGN